MILIITPSLSDFKRTCATNGIECKYNFNGMPANPNIKWIHTWKNLPHTTIKNDAKIIYGEQSSKMKVDELNKIQHEIELRKKNAVSPRI